MKSPYMRTFFVVCWLSSLFQTSPLPSSVSGSSSSSPSQTAVGTPSDADPSFVLKGE